MAFAPKKKKTIAARAVRAPTKSAPDEALAAPAFAAGETVADEIKSVAAPMAEAQQRFRGALEKSVVESRTAFAKAKTTADEAASAIEVSFVAAKDGALAISAKGFEALRANADANFDFLKALCAARSLPDLVALQTEFARKQVEAFTSQTKDLGALTQKAMTDAVEPIKEQVAKSFKIAV
jgi:phasin